MCGEEVGVQVEFRNPLAVKLKVGRNSVGQPAPDCVATFLRTQSSSLPVRCVRKTGRFHCRP